MVHLIACFLLRPKVLPRYRTKRVEIFRAASIALLHLSAIGTFSGVEASPPTKRADCAVGWFDVAIDAQQNVRSVDPRDTRFRATGGDGKAINCAVRIHNGLYAYGEIGEVDAGLNVSLTLDNVESVETFDLNADFRRIGVGYDLSVSNDIDIYGQIGYLHSDYDFEPIFVIFGSVPSQTDSAGFQNKGNGIDFETGFVWTSSESLAMSGFVRFAERNRLTFGGSDTPVFAVRNEDDTRVGAQIRVRLAEPIHLAAEAEFGSLDILFVGLAVRF